VVSSVLAPVAGEEPPRWLSSDLLVSGSPKTTLFITTLCRPAAPAGLARLLYVALDVKEPQVVICCGPSARWAGSRAPRPHLDGADGAPGDAEDARGGGAIGDLGEAGDLAVERGCVPGAGGSPGDALDAAAAAAGASALAEGGDEDAAPAEDVEVAPAARDDP
jgi:hypothetical protein